MFRAVIEVDAPSAGDAINAIVRGAARLVSIDEIKEERAALVSLSEEEFRKAALSALMKPLSQRTQVEVNIVNDFMNASGAGRSWAYFLGPEGIEMRPINA